jgi:hypothetical protein
VLIEIRPASAANGPAITEVRRETWLAAYAQIIDPVIIARLTAPGGRAGVALRPAPASPRARRQRRPAPRLHHLAGVSVTG